MESGAGAGAGAGAGVDAILTRNLGYLRDMMGPLGSSWGRFFSHLEATLDYLRAVMVSDKPSWGSSGPSWPVLSHLGPTSGYFWPS